MIQINIKSKTLITKTYYNQIRTLFSVDGKWTKIDEVYTADTLMVASLLKQMENHWKPIVKEYWSEVLRNNASSHHSKYILSMFPYPSGSAHLGHVRIYSTSDILARYFHLLDKPVIHPMGFDSFGLPAENAARLNSVEPNEWTKLNIRQMRAQFDKLGFEFNWRENTNDKSYYKWTQWLFLQLYKFGLAYRGMGFVNWDPIDCTVLADEQVDEKGFSWRSGAKVEKKAHRQWFIKTNSFANDLYKATDVDTSGHWAEIITHQRWWIKQPNGYLFYLKINESEDVLQVFTKYPELFLSNKVFVAISSKHWLSLSDKVIDKIVNPFTNTVMDIRIVDNDNIPNSTQSTIMVLSESFENTELRDNVLNRSKELNIGGYFTSDHYRDWLISRQRYWGTPIPIVYCDTCGIQPVSEVDLPIELPTLANVKNNLRKTEQISNPIKDYAPLDWLYTECPNCGSAKAIRETETCDTFFDSSWYFLRYITEPMNNLPFDPLRVEPTWCYVGGREHSALHLFYARFITHFLHDKGLCHFREPFKTLLMQRPVKAVTYKLNGKYITAEEAQLHKDVVVEDIEKMSKSKGNGVNPDDLVDAYGSDAMRWCILSDENNPKKDRIWSSDHTKEFHSTLLFLRRVLITIEEFMEIRQFTKDPENFTRKLKIKPLTDNEIESAKNKLNKQRNTSNVEVRKHLEYTYMMKSAITGLHLLLAEMRKYSQVAKIRTVIPLTLEYERALASLIIMMSPFVPHFAAECWTSFAREAVGSYEYDINKSILYQKWPTIDDDMFLHDIIFYYTNKKGQQEQCLKILVKRKDLGNWTQQEIRKVIEEHPNSSEIMFSDNIEKINIIRDVLIDVRLKVKPKVDNISVQKSNP